MNEESKIACHVCRKEIPEAAALHAEGREYVLHFCKIECLEFWKKTESKKDPAEK